MSTILKALKKLEQEGKHTGPQHAGADLNTRQVFHKAVRFAWIKRVGLRWLLICIGLSAGAAGLYFAGTSRQLFSNVNLSWLRDEKARPMSGEQFPLTKETPPSSSTGSQTYGPSPSGRKPSAVDERLATMPARRQPISDTMTQENPPNRVKPRPPSEAFREPASSTAKTVGSLSESPAQTSGQAYPDAERMIDGRLKVQAIAWSPVAEECMAVVNDRIVHQGDAVDGFSVLAVEADQIVVRSGGRIWAVAFGQGRPGAKANPGSP